jgi:cellulose synthase operon protein B
MRASLVRLGAATLLAAALLHLPAPAVAELPDAGATAPSEQRFVALATLLAPSDHLEIRGRVGRIDLALPLEEGAVVQQAALKLAYLSSPALVSERSRMVVVLNQNALAELPLAPRRDPTRAELTLPSELFQPGSNLLSLSAVQEHRDGCRRSLIDDLWTRIDPSNSYVAIRLARRDVPLDLADFGAPNWPIGRDGAAVPVVTTAPIETDAWLRIGGLVAQGVALRTDRPVTLQHRVLTGAPASTEQGDGTADQPLQSLPFAHHVLLGTADQLAQVLGPHAAAAIIGPYLGVRSPVADGDPAALIVSGRDEDDVLFAARAFANPALPLVDAPLMIIDTAPAPGVATPPFIVPGQLHTLAQLADPETLPPEGEPEQRTSFAIMLPPDFYVTDNRKAELRLNYGYKPNLGAGSGLHVIINGAYAGLINLEGRPEGGIVEGQSVRVPVRLFRPGRNVLSFEPALTNEDAVACGPVVDSGPSVGVFGDSTIRLPEVSRVVTLPDLGLMTSLAFPYGGDPAAGVVATSYDPATVGAVWTLVGKLAQTAGMPLPDLNLSFAASDHLHSLFVGPLEQMDRRLLARTPVEQIHLRPSDAEQRAGAGLGVGLQAALNQPLAAQAMGEAAPGTGSRLADRATWEREVGPSAAAPAGALDRFAAALDGLMRRISSAAAAAVPAGWSSGGGGADVSFLGDPSKEFDGAALTMASPFTRRGTATIITAIDPPALERAMAELIQPATWYGLRGDVSVWAVGRPGAAAAQVGTRFPMDDPPDGLRQTILYLNSYLAEHPALWVIAVVLGILVLAALTSLASRNARGRE